MKFKIQLQNNVDPQDGEALFSGIILAICILVGLGVFLWSSLVLLWLNPITPSLPIPCTPPPPLRIVNTLRISNKYLIKPFLVDI